MEKVIQMYLRNEYATITEYNEKAGSMAEKYHFLVIADFPANFSDTAARRLAEHRRQRRALRRLHAHPMGPAAAAAGGICAR